MLQSRTQVSIAINETQDHAAYNATNPDPSKVLDLAKSPTTRHQVDPSQILAVMTHWAANPEQLKSMFPSAAGGSLAGITSNGGRAINLREEIAKSTISKQPVVLHNESRASIGTMNESVQFMLGNLAILKGEVQKTVDDELTRIRQCNEQCRVDFEMPEGSHPGECKDATVAGATAKSRKEAHTTCRSSEFAAFRSKNEACRKLRREIQAIRVAKAGTDGVFATVQDVEDVDVEKDADVDDLKEAGDTVVGWLREIEDHYKEDKDDAVQDLVTKCKNAKDECANWQTTCNIKQTEYEQGVCTWSGSTAHVCTQHATCYTNALESYNHELQLANDALRHWQVEYTAWLTLGAC
jgi:hypothetical protein